jgi:hypothetical protein
MPSVSGLANDIFISYAHADNTEEWVDHFHDRMLHKLRQLDRQAPFAIWRDRKLSGADVFSDEIDRQLRSSGLLISILSPNGLDSRWCQQERERFERAASSTGGLRLGTKIRAIRVTKTPCTRDEDRHIFGTVGYEFYVRSEQTGRFSEFHPTSREFDDLVLDLSQEVYALLQELRNQLRAPPPDLAVYVAEVHSKLESWRTRVVNELTAWNCRVYPEAPFGSQLSASVISECLSSCSVSIHCVGSLKGLTPENEDRPIDELQLIHARLAQIDRIVCQIEEPHAGLKELLKPTNSHSREELIRPATQDVLLQLLEDRVTSMRNGRADTPGDVATVYVVCSPSEWNEALRLKQCLEAERRFAAILPIRDVDDTSVRLRDHRATLKSCQAVMVYWGAMSSASWFREQQREVIGARQKRRTKPLPALCLSSSPEADTAADSLPSLPLQQVLNLDCSSVRQYFQLLEAPARKAQA